MKRAMFHFIVQFGLSLACAAPARSAPAEDVRASRVQEAKALGMAVREAVLKRDVGAIAALYPDFGIPCGDELIPKREILRALATPGDELRAYFFDEEAYARIMKKQGNLRRPISLHEFFRRAESVEIVAEFARLASGLEELDAPCIRFRAPNLEFKPFLCLLRDEGRLYVIEGTPPCD